MRFLAGAFLVNQTSRLEFLLDYSASSESCYKPERRCRNTTAQIEIDVHLGHGEKFRALPLATWRKLVSTESSVLLNDFNTTQFQGHGCWIAGPTTAHASTGAVCASTDAPVQCCTGLGDLALGRAGFKRPPNQAKPRLMQSHSR